MTGCKLPCLVTSLLKKEDEGNLILFLKTIGKELIVQKGPDA